jgi:hypothetical protein
MISWLNFSVLIGSSLLFTFFYVNYILYYWFPLSLPLPRIFPWPWRVSALIAVLITIPALYLMLRGVKDAGEKTIRPKREHGMYGGIYTRIQPPQAVGEFPF